VQPLSLSSIIAANILSVYIAIPNVPLKIINSYVLIIYFKEISQHILSVTVSFYAKLCVLK